MKKLALLHVPRLNVVQKIIKLPQQREETFLTEFQEEENTFQLHPEALGAWRTLKDQARKEGIELYLVSAYRSVLRQKQIIEEKVKKGIRKEEIFRVNASPGFSEHHTGRAIDINTPGYPALEEAFDQSRSFRWLMERGKDFDFRLSYPKNNKYGIAYEPWHWFYQGAHSTTRRWG